MWFRKDNPEARLDGELRYHFEKLVRDFVAEGVTPDEARRRARLEFGGLDQIKDECRDVRGLWLEDFAKDLRYTARTLRRSPGFLAVAVLSLALGIGANTAIFTLINAVMLRSLPVREPASLVQVMGIMQDGKAGALSYPLFQHLRENLKAVSEASAEWGLAPVIVIDGQDEVLSGEMVSGAHFAML